jgi:hypothetical protein
MNDSYSSFNNDPDMKPKPLETEDDARSYSFAAAVQYFWRREGKTWRRKISDFSI